MKTRIELWRWTCDGCGRVAMSETLPPGWKNGTLTLRGCGLTNYTRHEPRDACPDCPKDAIA